MTLADLVREAAQQARRWAEAFPETVGKDDLPWKAVEAFDADVRGAVERDPRIEDARDRVLIAAVNLAETPAEDEPDALDEPRRHLIAAIDGLEQAVMRLGVVNRRAEKLGYGTAGAPVSAGR